MNQIKQTQETFEDETELIDYLRVMWKWKWLIIGGTLLCILAVAIYGFTRPAARMYKVSTLIEIDPKAKLDPLDKIKSMIDYGIFNQQILKGLSNLQRISKPEPLVFEVNIPRSLNTDIPRSLNILDIAYETPDVDLGKVVLNSLVKQLEQEYSQKARYQFEKKLNEITMHIARIEAHNEKIRLIEGRIAHTKKVFEEAQSSSDKLAARKEASLLDLNDRSGYDAFMHAAAIKQVIDYPVVLRERIDSLASEKIFIPAEIMDEISIIKDLAAGIKSFKITGEANVGDKKNFILKLKSEIDSLRSELSHLTGVIVRQTPTASPLPIKYKTKRNALLAAIVGFVTLVFLALFIEYIRNALKPYPIKKED